MHILTDKLQNIDSFVNLSLNKKIITEVRAVDLLVYWCVVVGEVPDLIIVPIEKPNSHHYYKTQTIK